MTHYYLDANAHIPRRKYLSKKSLRLLEDIENSHIVYGHPLSPNKPGSSASSYIETARNIISESLGVNSNEIHFTRSCTEANEMVGRALQKTQKEIYISPLEHKSMADALAWSTKYHVIDVDRFGQPIFSKPVQNCVFVGAQSDTG